MMRLEIGLHAAISLVLTLFPVTEGPQRLAAATRDELSLADQSTPELRVRVYGFSALTPDTIKGAETEATRILNAERIKVEWIDCIRESESVCTNLPDRQTDLIVRIIPKALSRAKTDVFGVAIPTGTYPAAFIFFDRINNLRTYRRPVYPILGRVMVHEITHLLLPEVPHSAFGLMSGRWTSDYLDITAHTFLGLSPQCQELFRENVSQRRFNLQSRMR